MSHDIRSYLKILNEAMFAPDQPIGTILQVRSASAFGSDQTVMKMASGEWQDVLPQGYDKGVPIFALGDTTADPALLDAAHAANRIGLVVKGISQGGRIATGIQTMALPVGAVVGNPSLPDRKYVRQAEGMVDASTGKPLPEWAFNAANAVWLE